MTLHASGNEVDYHLARWAIRRLVISISALDASIIRLCLASTLVLTTVLFTNDAFWGQSSICKSMILLCTCFLVSPGNVHSSEEHLYASEIGQDQRVKKFCPRDLMTATPNATAELILSKDSKRK